MMTKIKKTPPIILLVFTALALLATACSPSAAEKLNKEGNEAFEKQAFEDALVDYQTAQIKEPELAEPYYNAANALYRQGQYEAALEQLNMALSYAEDASLTGHSLFNMGNSSYNAQDLGTAVAAYTEALLLNPDDPDAKYNLELALQQQEQQQQDQQDQQQDQQQQDQQQSEDQQQQDQSQDGEGQQDQQQQDQEQQDPQDGQNGEQDQQEQSDQPQDGQNGEQQEQDGQPQDGQQGEDQQDQQPSQVPAPGQKMTQEQAEQLLAAIAGDSQTLQEKLGQIFAVPWKPPVQDW